MSRFDQIRTNLLNIAFEHEQKSSRYARFGDEIVEWFDPTTGHIVTKFRKQDPPLIKYKSGFAKAIEHKTKAIDRRDEVKRMDARRFTAVPEEGPKPWGRAQRILYNRGYKRLEDTCFRRP